MACARSVDPRLTAQPTTQPSRGARRGQRDDRIARLPGQGRFELGGPACSGRYLPSGERPGRGHAVGMLGRQAFAQHAALGASQHQPASDGPDTATGLPLSAASDPGTGPRSRSQASMTRSR